MKSNPISKVFTDMVNQYPSNVAIIDSDGITATYKQLDDMASTTANELASIGVVKGQHLAIDSRKSISGVALLVAAWKLSCSYTFINVSQPPDRILSIIQDI